MLLSYFSIFAASFVIAISGALMPGPLLTAVISESARHGFKAGPLMVFGHALIEMFLVVLIILGLGSFINNPLAYKLIAAGGALILCYFGLSMITSARTLSLRTETANSKQGQLVLTGALLSLTNPYWSIWWLSIGLGLIFAALKVGMIALLFFFAGHILADLVWYTLVAFGISHGKKLISDPLYRGLIMGCGTLLLVFAGYFAATLFS